jgi:hypothetical protein
VGRVYARQVVDLALGAVRFGDDLPQSLDETRSGHSESYEDFPRASAPVWCPLAGEFDEALCFDVGVGAFAVGFVPGGTAAVAPSAVLARIHRISSTLLSKVGHRNWQGHCARLDCRACIPLARATRCNSRIRAGHVLRGPDVNLHWLVRCVAQFLVSQGARRCPSPPCVLARTAEVLSGIAANVLGSWPHLRGLLHADW